ncbi:MAG TPA: type IV secretory system conjugative DNA transfer family protein [Rhodanobacteraceae bacterium]|nr:type IV secretory system conjugative DNA transfer family protein [Rhodanobacteraceae bacterium]
MTRNASAPFWVRAILVVLLALCAVPVWLWLAGHAYLGLAFHGHGQPVATLMTWPLYFHAYRSFASVRHDLLISGAAATAVVLAPVALFFIKPQRAQHGQARFAKVREIRKAGLLDDASDGIIVGRRGSKFLTASLQRYPHVMLAAPTGSGKGVGVVIPNLLNWNHSVIVLDIKKENWEITAGFRAAHGHDVFLFDPASPLRQTHRWNPLAYIREDASLRVDDIQKIAHILFPDIAGTDPIWTASCRSLFLGLVLYLLETPGKQATLGQVARESFAGDDQRFTGIIEARQAQGTPYSDSCTHALLDYVRTSDNTRTSIRKTFTSRFELFLNPILDAATSANDFDLEALRRRRTSIYIGITPDNLFRLSSLLNLFFQQVVDLNTRELPERNPALKYQCLLLLDEFRSLGKMPLIVEAVAFLRGYGVRLLPIFQSPSQIRELYGEEAARTFFQNHQVRISYTPPDMTVATEISRELGTYTYQARSTSRPSAFSKGTRSMSESDHARALLLPQEVKEIGEEEALILVKGCKPIQADKIRWHRDPALRYRRRPPPRIAPVPLVDSGGIDDTASSRPVEATDLDTLYERPLSDFCLDLSDVAIPSGESSEVEAQTAADQLFSAMTR